MSATAIVGGSSFIYKLRLNKVSDSELRVFLLVSAIEKIIRKHFERKTEIPLEEKLAVKCLGLLACKEAIEAPNYVRKLFPRVLSISNFEKITKKTYEKMEKVIPKIQKTILSAIKTGIEYVVFQIDIDRKWYSRSLKVEESFLTLISRDNKLREKMIREMNANRIQLQILDGNLGKVEVYRKNPELLTLRFSLQNFVDEE